MDTNKIHVVDARQMVPPEPFEATMLALDKVAVDEKVLLLLYREPHPLYRILERNGHAFEVSHADDGTVQILISPA